jgi:hypothetical protein
MLEPSQNSGLQKGDTKQPSYWGLTDIGRHRTKFVRLGDLATEIFLPCSICVLVNRRFETAPIDYHLFLSKRRTAQRIA